nr:hypothetical protein [Tanacetum cinerariifolium]
MYDSWKSIMELYMLNRQHGRMILESVEDGPLLWPTFEENRVTRPKKYFELSAMEAIQADCDVKATNIILQGLPPKVYALVSTHKVAKELWERIQILMQGTSLTKQERECKLYDEFDMFAYKKGESLRDFYLRFSLLLNDMNIYNMKLAQFQVNMKFLNTLPPESPYHSSQYASQAQSTTPLLITYPSNDFQSSVNHNVYNPSSSIPQVVYAPAIRQQSEFSQPDTGLVVPVFQKGDDPIVDINHMMSFLTAVVTSRYPPTNNQLRTSSNHRRQAIINNGRIALMADLSHYGSDNLAENSSLHAQQDDLILSVIEQLQTQVVNCTKINQDNKNVNEILTAELERYKDQVRILKAKNNVDKASESCAQSLVIDNLKHTLSEHLKEKESFEKMVTLLKNNFQKEESRNIDRELALEKHLELKLYNGSVIQKTDAIVIPDSKETIMLEDNSRSKIIQKQKDPMMAEKKVNTKPVDYVALNQHSQDFKTRFVPQTKLSTEQAFWS